MSLYSFTTEKASAERFDNIGPFYILTMNSMIAVPDRLHYREVSIPKVVRTMLAVSFLFFSPYVCAHDLSIQIGALVGTGLHASVKLNIPAKRIVNAGDVRAGSTWTGWSAAGMYLRETPLPFSGIYWGVAVHVRAESDMTMWGIGIPVGGEVFIPLPRDGESSERNALDHAHTCVVEIAPVWFPRNTVLRVEALIGWRWGVGR